ncbi:MULTISPECIES: hypothetical protein [Vagococcus]|uniref:ECF-type sigma factor negative effector n=1 Tax=Vagococcus fluvialis bH819 TaxID=1255619 RepID=A0A1X6WPB6_9ENTE|nr:MULTISPECIES: hypothetical protein [Vagococcus]SLM86173.1 ECF-type sigma factor negative effector [Vagococcus fluvialis bH819]HCM90421.1 hypothetical protein [Vagococcus sp.]
MSKDDQKIIEEFAEKLSLEEFDNVQDSHQFSIKYQHKKNKLKKRVAKKGRFTEWSTHKIAVAAIFIIVIPTTAYGAKNWYEWLINKNKHELTISLKNNVEKNNEKKYYQLSLPVIPKEMIQEDNHLKYKNKANEDSIIFNLWRIRKEINFQELFTESYEKKNISGHKSIILKKADEEFSNFNRTVYMVFDKEQILVEATVSKNMTNDELLKILESTSLKEVSKEESNYIFDEGDFEKRVVDSNSVKEELVKGLPKSSKNLYLSDEKITYHNKQKKQKLSFKLNKIEVLDNIKRVLDQKQFNPESLEHVRALNMLDENGQLNEYKQTVYELGDGVDELNKVVEEKEIKPKFIYLTASVTNLSNKTIKDLYMTGPIVYFEEKMNKWNYIDDKNKMFLPQSQTLNIDYFDDGKGSSQEFLTIEPKETITYRFGFFVDEDKLDKMFLPIVPYDHEYDAMNLDDNRIWMDIRQ